MTFFRACAWGVTVAALGAVGCRGEEFVQGSGGAGGAATVSSTTQSGSGGAQPVSVQVSLVDAAGGPLPTRDYLHLDPAGSVLAEGLLDAQGEANVQALSGDWIAVFEGVGPVESRRYAYMAELSADSLELRFHHRLLPQNTPAQLTVTAECASCFGLDKVGFYASCTPAILKTPAAGNSIQTHVFTGFSGCRGASQFDVHVVGYNAGGQPVQLASRRNNPMGTASPALAATAAVGSMPIAWTVQNPPAGYGVQRRLVALRSDGSSGFELLEPSGDSVFAVHTAAELFPGDLRVVTRSYEPDRLQGVLESFATDLSFSSVVFDAASLAIPAEVVSLDRSEPGRPGVPVALLGGPTGDALQATIKSSAVAWVIVRPATHSGVFRLPQLSSKLAAWALPALGSSEVVVSHVDDDAAAGYGALAAKGFTLDYEDAPWISRLRLGFERASVSR